MLHEKKSSQIGWTFFVEQVTPSRFAGSPRGQHPLFVPLEGGLVGQRPPIMR